MVIIALEGPFQLDVILPAAKPDLQIEAMGANRMIIRQLSTLLENKTGAMAAVLNLLKVNGVNLRALTLADSNEFGGVLRLITRDPEKVENLLRSSGYLVRNDPVLAILLEDDPGSLYEKMQKLSEAGINIEYTYAFAASADSGARAVLKTDDLAAADRLLRGQQQEITDEDLPQLYW